MKKKLVSTILAATAVGSMLVTGVSAEEYLPARAARSA